MTIATGLLGGVIAPLAVSAFVPSNWASVPEASLVGAVFASTALIAAFAAPQGSWRVGLLVLAPMAALLAFSLAFAGHLAAFLRHDLLPSATAFLSACGGAALGAGLRNRLRRAA